MKSSVKGKHRRSISSMFAATSASVRTSGRRELWAACANGGSCSVSARRASMPCAVPAWVVWVQSSCVEAAGAVIRFAISLPSAAAACLASLCASTRPNASPGGRCSSPTAEAIVTQEKISDTMGRKALWDHIRAIEQWANHARLSQPSKKI